MSQIYLAGLLGVASFADNLLSATSLHLGSSYPCKTLVGVHNNVPDLSGGFMRTSNIHENPPPIGGFQTFLIFEVLFVFLSSRALKWHKPGVSSFIR